MSDKTHLYSRALLGSSAAAVCVAGSAHHPLPDVGQLGREYSVAHSPSPRTGPFGEAARHDSPFWVELG